MKVRVQVDGEIYEVEIGDLNSRPIQAVVGGELFAVWPEEVAGVVTTASASTEPAGEAAPLPRRTSAPAPESDEEVIVAPLPGDIIVVAVQPGESVESGQLLCTLESMKMNNPVRSPRAGVVVEVLVDVGDHVNYGQPMVRLR
ncbi:MAG TPA: acetyl-CoA carboxylase biotin carboxyl carrier protein subunit [Chloroflexi bacterium]|nr:acetyl-CoA carboxylase biotin carboxyl carrier protein subunit [Chloroflexota bacterium]